MIGVVGGVGPYAGTDLVNKVLDQTRARGDREHLDIVLISAPRLIDDRTEFLLGRGRRNPAEGLFRVVRLLGRAGATVIGIPCNTAHAAPIFDVLRRKLRQGRSRVRLLHMIEEVAVFLREHHPSVRRVGLLATTGTCRAGAYEDVLRPLGIEVLLPQKAVQRGVHRAIYDRTYGIKGRGNPVTARARGDLATAADGLLRAGAQAVLLGCTELPLAFKERRHRGRPLIDSTLVLARALVRTASPGRLRKWTE